MRLVVRAENACGAREGLSRARVGDVECSLLNLVIEVSYGIFWSVFAVVRDQRYTAD